MKTKAQVKAMLEKIESAKGVVDGRQELIMALEWVLDESISTSIGLDTAIDGEEEYDLCAGCGGAIAKENDYCVACDIANEDAEIAQLKGEL